MHQKRVSAPRSWPVAKKTHAWIVRPNPGPHNMESSIPLLVLVRDMLKFADNSREAKRIINEGDVLVDGVVRRDYKFPVGLFDVVSIPKLNQYYRMLLNTSGKLILNPLGSADSTKLCRVQNKTILTKGIVQLNLHDGTNIQGSNELKTFDSVVISVPDKKIIKSIQCKPGNLAMIVGGNHCGETGIIKEIRKTRGSAKNMIGISGKIDFETIDDYVFVIGEQKPEIKLGGA